MPLIHIKELEILEILALMNFFKFNYIIPFALHYWIFVTIENNLGPNMFKNIVNKEAFVICSLFKEENDILF